MTQHKAQLSALDFLLAVSVTTIIVISIAFTLVQYEKRINDQVTYNDLLTQTFQISNTLVKNRGVPTNWNASTVEVIGLAIEDRIISDEKLQKFVNMPEQDAKKIMRTNLNFYFNIKRINGSSIASTGTEIAGNRSASIRRYVYYDNEEAIIEFALWE